MRGTPMQPRVVGLVAFVERLPLVTRCHLVMLAVTALLVNLNVVRERNLYFDAELVLRRGQVWRVLTAFGFFGRAGLSLLFYMQTHLFMGTAMESSAEGATQHVLLHALAMPLIVAAAAVLGDLPFLSHALFTAIMLFYSFTHPTHPVTFFGLWTIQAANLIWWSLAFQVITGQPLAGVLVGIGVGGVLWRTDAVARVPRRAADAVADFVRRCNGRDLRR